MDDQKTVFADAGPLIVLARTGQLHLLHDLFDVVHVTPLVRSEVLPGLDLPGELAIRHAIAIGYIREISENPPPLHGLSSQIHAGEASTIAAAVAWPGALILLDDQDARSCAIRLRLEVTGTIGIVLMAKQRGLIKAVSTVLESAIDQGLYITRDLVDAAISRAGESMPVRLARKLARRA